MLAFQRKILKKFRKLKGLAKVYVYGSVARGDYRLDSDLDVAIITNKKRIRKLAEKLANEIYLKEGRFVSLKFLKEEDLKKKFPLVLEIKKGKRII